MLGSPSLSELSVVVAPVNLGRQHVLISQLYALVSLSIEIYVLMAAAIPECDWLPFLGRCQFSRLVRSAGAGNVNYIGALLCQMAITIANNVRQVQTREQEHR